MRLHGAFATGQHQRIEGALEVSCLTQFEAFRSQLLQALLVFDEGSLNRKHRHGGGACGIARGCLDFGVAHY